MDNSNNNQKKIYSSLKRLNDLIESYLDFVDIDEAENEEDKSKDKSNDKEKED